MDSDKCLFPSYTTFDWSDDVEDAIDNGALPDLAYSPSNSITIHTNATMSTRPDQEMGHSNEGPDSGYVSQASEESIMVDDSPTDSVTYSDPVAQTRVNEVKYDCTWPRNYRKGPAYARFPYRHVSWASPIIDNDAIDGTNQVAVDGNQAKEADQFLDTSMEITAPARDEKDDDVDLPLLHEAHTPIVNPSLLPEQDPFETGGLEVIESTSASDAWTQPQSQAPEANHVRRPPTPKVDRFPDTYFVFSESTEEFMDQADELEELGIEAHVAEVSQREYWAKVGRFGKTWQVGRCDRPSGLRRSWTIMEED